MSHQPPYGTPASLTKLSLAATKLRIIEQDARVRSLEPGTPHHRLAVGVLLLLQDSLHVLTEAQEMIRAVRLAASKDTLAA